MNAIATISSNGTPRDIHGGVRPVDVAFWPRLAAGALRLILPPLEEPDPPDPLCGPEAFIAWTCKPGNVWGPAESSWRIADILSSWAQRRAQARAVANDSSL